MRFRSVCATPAVRNSSEPLDEMTSADCIPTPLPAVCWPDRNDQFHFCRPSDAITSIT